jgi:hypothetical protein
MLQKTSTGESSAKYDIETLRICVFVSLRAIAAGVFNVATGTERTSIVDPATFDV